MGFFVSKLSSWEKSFCETYKNARCKREIWQRKVDNKVVVEIIYIKSHKEERCIYDFCETYIYEHVNDYPNFDIFSGYKYKENVVQENLSLVKIIIDIFLKNMGFEIDEL